MKKSLLLLITTIISASSAFADCNALIERVDTDALGDYIQDIRIFGDGTVTRENTYRACYLGLGPVLAELGNNWGSDIEEAIWSLPAGQIERVDPNQEDNGSNITSFYFANSNSGQITFHETVNGVDFGLPNGTGTDLKTLLDSFAQ